MKSFDHRPSAVFYSRSKDLSTSLLENLNEIFRCLMMNRQNSTSSVKILLKEDIMLLNSHNFDNTFIKSFYSSNSIHFMTGVTIM